MLFDPRTTFRDEPAVPLGDDHIAVLGCGSVGGLAAWALASAGVGSLALADKDRLEAGNLRRHVCGAGEVGTAKSLAVARFLAERFPAVRVVAHDLDFLADPDALRELVSASAAAVVAVDNEAPKHLIDAMARELGVPAVYVGIYGGGWAGEVILSDRTTPCYACSARSLGRVGVNVDLDLSTDYALPVGGASESDWPRADLTSLMPVAAFAARLVAAVLKVGHGWRTDFDEFTRAGANAWRLLLRDVPGWGSALQTVRPVVRREVGCWTCAGGE